MSSWNPDIFEKAWNFATRHHQGQTYGGTKEGERMPYINHIGSVATEIMWALQFDENADADLAVQCAVLHDTIEDTPVTYEFIEKEFGTAVAKGVLALSKNPRFPTKDEQIRDSLRRIKQQPIEVWMVKLADRIANLSYPPHHWNNKKILSYRDEAMIIHTELHSASFVLAQRLQNRIETYPQYLQQESMAKLITPANHAATEFKRF